MTIRSLSALFRANALLLSAIVLLSIRLATLSYPDLTDPSEGRFASISQHLGREDMWMPISLFVSNKGWIDYQAKPPLFMWLQKISFECFGENAFSARLPSFLGLIFSLGGIFALASRYENKDDRAAIVPVFIYLCLPLPLFLGTSGITDPALTAATTWIGVAGLIWINGGSNLWLLLVLICSLMGLLVKGPIALVLTFPPLALIYLFGSTKRSLWPAVVTCSALLLAALFIFLGLDQQSPGFMRYFLVNENFGRFLGHDFGNRYGSVKLVPYGAAIFYLLIHTLPLTHLIRFKNIRYEYMLLACWPAVFFAFSNQVLVSYLLPATPWIALLISSNNSIRSSFLRIMAPCIVLTCTLVAGDAWISNRFSARRAAEEIKELNISSLEISGLNGGSILFYGTQLGLEFFPSDGEIRSTHVLSAAYEAGSYENEDFEIIKKWPKMILARRVAKNATIAPLSQAHPQLP